MINATHSGLAVVVLLVVLVSRIIGAQRRRSMGRPGTRGFTSMPEHRQQAGPAAGHHPSGASNDGTTSSGSALGGTAPGWFRDPFVRHDHRYWSGSAWTEQVQDNGVPGVDPPPPPRGPTT